MKYVKFNIKSSFFLTTRKIFVIVGQMDEGDIKKVNEIFDKNMVSIMSVSSIEQVLITSTNDAPALVITYDNEKQRELLETLKSTDYIFVNN